jgi:hypothetical protein
MSYARDGKYSFSGSVVALAIMSIPVLAFAQHSRSTSTQEARILSASEVSGFVSAYGIPVILGDNPLSEQISEVSPGSLRLATLTRMADHANATWRKIYRITPASASEPVTTLARAEEMVDEHGGVTLSVFAASAGDVERRIAMADGADATYPDGEPNSDISVNLTNATTAEAIAAVAAITHTHWLAAYYVAPVAKEPTATPIQITMVGSSYPMTEQEYEERYLNNGPFPLRTAPPPPQPTVIAASPGGSDKNNQPAPLQVNPNNGASSYTEPMTPAVVNDPYGYNGLMYAPNYTFGGTQIINPFQSD